jgi:hypothetical protein
MLFGVSLHRLFGVPSGMNHVAPRCVRMVFLSPGVAPTSHHPTIIDRSTARFCPTAITSVSCPSFSRGRGEMALTLHRTLSTAYRDMLDYVIVNDGRYVGRLYEDRHSRPASRWFWTITIYVNPQLEISTSGHAPSLEQAKAQFLTNWRKCRAEPASP